MKSLFLSVLPGISFLLPLGLCGLILSLRKYEKSGLLLIFFIAYSLPVILTIVTWRYRLPLTLALWPFAGFFIVKTLENVRRKQIPALMLSTLLLTGFSALGYASAEEKLYYEKHMVAAEAKMSMSKAERDIRKEMESNALAGKDNSAIWIRLAKLRYMQLDVEGAVKILRNALADNPKQHTLWRVLEEILLNTGDYDGAKEAKDNYIKYKPAPSSER